MLRKKDMPFLYFPISHNLEDKVSMVNKSDRKPRKVQFGGGGKMYKTLSEHLKKSSTKLHLHWHWCQTQANSHPSHAGPDYALKSATVCYLQNIKPSINVSDPIKQFLAMTAIQLNENETLMIIWNENQMI